MLDALKARRGRLAGTSGLTLMELMVTVAILAILVALAMPSFNAFVAKGRLSGAAEALAQDLQLARSEALRLNTEVRFSFSPGSTWCYGSIASSTACSCTTANDCTLRQVDGSAYAGVTMSMPDPTFASNTAIFTARQGLANTGAVQFTHPNAGTLRVSLGAAGQVSICSTSGGLGHHPAC
jgi:prepilin-type N-terminal cleavage/methylation domain-containing protein